MQTLQTFLVSESVSAKNQNLDLTLIDDRSSHLKIGNLATINVNSGNKTDIDSIISGTYIHPALFVSIAGWISPKFEIIANLILTGYIRNEYKYKISNIQLQLEDAINSEARLKQVILEAGELREAASRDAYLAQQQAHQLEVTVQKG